MENSVNDCRAILDSENYSEVFLQYKDEQEVRDLLDVACIQRLNGNYLIVSLAENEEAPRDNILILPRCYALMSQNALDEMGVLELRRRPYPDLFGRDVLIGIIDDGIDIANNLFINEDGTSRIVSVWNQADSEGTVPEGFLYGSEYILQNINIRESVSITEPNEELNQAGLYDISSIIEKTSGSGHGTFMAAAAAGGRYASASETGVFDAEMVTDINSAPISVNSYTGVAPFSELVIVKLREAKRSVREFYRISDNVACYQETDIAIGVNYILDAARKKRRPVIICLGMGTTQGGHNGFGVLDSWLSFLAEFSGIGIITAAGNEGNSAGHFRGQGNTEVRMRVGANEPGFCMEIWTNVPNIYRLGIISPGGEIIETVPERMMTSRTYSFVFERTVLDVIYLPEESIRGGVLTFIRFTTPTEGIWKFNITDQRGYGGNFDIWLPVRGFISDDTYFLQSDPDFTVTSPGNSRYTICATAYDTTTLGVWLDSGRGYTRDGRVKPDISAPGVNITIPGLGTASGTSIAAAYTAGCAALLFEWGIIEYNNYGMNTIDLKNLMISGAERGPSEYPNRDWGWGRLNVFESIAGQR